MNSLFTLQLDFIRTHRSVELDIGISSTEYTFTMTHKHYPVSHSVAISKATLHSATIGYGETITVTWQKMYDEIQEAVTREGQRQ